MDYELALKLRKAGFPHYIPTLEKLIEACGDFAALCKASNGSWTAESWSDHEVTGPTPIEAVANLWLALNKHD